MFLLENKKNILAVLMATSIITLSGCASTDANQATHTSSSASTVAVPVETRPIQNTSSLNSQDVDTGLYKDNDGLETKKLSLVPQSRCIKELDSLKTFSPSDYQFMMNAFKDISEINTMYRSVENTASKDSLDLLKMSIESKTEVLCAKVRYLSIMSVNSTLKKLGD